MSLEVLSEAAFRRVVSLERKRSERSQRPFALLLVDTGNNRSNEKRSRGLLDLLAALRMATRETDVTGWYETNSVVGVIFTEIVMDHKQVLSTILSRVASVLREQLDTEHFGRIKFSFHV